MPIYEYQCQACGKEMEISQRITEPALTECPECQAPKLQRLISATSFQLKGGGVVPGWIRGRQRQAAQRERPHRPREQGPER